MKIERGYAQHVGSRNEQQDAGLVLTDDAQAEQLVVVADGMGGHAGGSLASAQVAETARRIWDEHKKTPLEPKRLLERIIREGHESINRAGAEKGLTPRSTCALLFLRNGGAHWAHIGDSRIYRLRDGQVTRLTRDHSVVQMLVDLGKVDEDEMGSHPDQNRLTQSLGGEAQPMPDFGNDGVKEHDAFLVCSDGLWEMIPQVEMASALSAKKLGDDGAKHLVERAFDRAKPRSDNITVALLRMGGPAPGAIGADFEEARTTRMPGVPPVRRGAEGRSSMRWGFVAATVVGLGAAAAVVYKPWEKQGLDTTTTPVVGPKEKPAETTPPPQEKRTEPAKPDPAKPDAAKPDPAKPDPVERREGPSPPLERAPDAPPPRDQQPAPDATPPRTTPPTGPGQPTEPGQPGIPPPGGPQQPGDRGSTKPPAAEPPATGGEPDKKQAQPKPAAPAKPPAAPRQSGLGPDEKKNTEPPPNTEKPPAAQPQGPGPDPETKPQ